jgi:2'-5' RNA ligase
MSPLPVLHETALLVPVSAAEGLVGDLRREHDPSASAGVPAHVTVMVPFLTPKELDAEVIAELTALISAVPGFSFRLASVGWFGRTVLYLAPEPAGPFVALTEAVAEAFGTAPYGGDYDDIVPHLTVAHASDGVELSAVADRLRPGLPLDCEAEEVWLMESDVSLWRRSERIALAPKVLGR